jgi:hypothetical protein
MRPFKGSSFTDLYSTTSPILASSVLSASAPFLQRGTFFVIVRAKFDARSAREVHRPQTGRKTDRRGFDGVLARGDSRYLVHTGQVRDWIESHPFGAIVTVALGIAETTDP